MKGLTETQIKDLPSWDTTKLIDTFEGYSDRKKLIDTQNNNGIAHKSVADSDVQDLYDSYNALRTELVSRLKSKAEIDIFDKAEDYSNQIALVSAGGALGIPITAKTETEVSKLKNNYNVERVKLDNNLGL